jgi:hypothetical protein
MSKQDCAYIRQGKKIKCVIEGENYGKVETYPSISAAKKRSLELQSANGGRGAGYVRVERKRK